MSALHVVQDVGDRFAITNPHEVRTLLRRLVDQRSLLTAHFGEGRLFLLTAILGFSQDGRYLYLDTSPEEHTNRRTLQAERLLCSSQLDHVEIRFSTGPAVAAEYEGLPAFRVETPERLRYLQRREYYRLLVPITHALTCQISHYSPQGTPLFSVKTRVVDISLGGLALVVPAAAQPFMQPDAVFPQCIVELPDTGRFEATIRVRHVFDTRDGRGLPRTQAGVEFQTLPASAQSLVQRYIMRVERERIARERGLL
jgi:flagellar brake protein